MRTRGLAMIEVLISAIIIAVLFIAAVSTAASARGARQRALDLTTGQSLARMLMSEIDRVAYCEPGTLPTSTLGREAGEVAGQRTTFDDLDDYAGYTQSPATLRDGTVIAGSLWRWEVSVAHLASLSGTTTPVETGLRQVTVSVYRGQRLVARVNQVRSHGGG